MSVCFNKSYTALVTSTAEGYKLYDIVDSIYPDFITKLRRNCEIPQGKIRFIGDILHNLVGVMVLENRPKELILWDFDNKVEKGSFSYIDNILAAKLSSTLIIVFFLDCIAIHNHENESKYEVLMPANPKAIGDFVKRVGRLAYPTGKGPNNLYRVVIKNVYTKHNVVTIDAHKNPIAAIAFSQSGFRVAIACEKGNEIYIFNSQTGVKLHACFRGMTNVTISSLVINKTENYLAVSSNSGTVHVFLLSSTHENLAIESESDDKFSLTLPEGKNGTGSICAIKGEGYKFRLMVILPPHCLYVHYIPDFFGESNGSYKLYDLLKTEETEMVQFSVSQQPDDDAGAPAIVESTV